MAGSRTLPGPSAAAPAAEFVVMGWETMQVERRTFDI